MRRKCSVIPENLAFVKCFFLVLSCKVRAEISYSRVDPSKDL